MVPNRPLTHDLIKTFCTSYGVNVREIVIYKFQEGVFYSKRSTRYLSYLLSFLRFYETPIKVKVNWAWGGVNGLITIK